MIEHLTECARIRYDLTEEMFDHDQLSEAIERSRGDAHFAGDVVAIAVARLLGETSS